MGFAHYLEALFRGLVTRVNVRVKLSRQPAVSLLDLFRLSVSLQPQYFVVILLGHLHIFDFRFSLADLKKAEGFSDLPPFQSAIGNRKSKIPSLVLVDVNIFRVDHVIFTRVARGRSSCRRRLIGAGRLCSSSCCLLVKRFGQLV